MLKASSVLTEFLLAPQPAQAQHDPERDPKLTVTSGNKQVILNWPGFTLTPGLLWAYRQKKGAGSYGGWQDIPGGETVSSHTVTGLENGSAYTFQVAIKVSGISFPHPTRPVQPQRAAAPLLLRLQRPRV